MTSAISIRDLRLSLAGKPILDGVFLEVDRSELVAIVGPNGAGKSTLLRCLMGIATGWRGEIEIQGTPLGRYGAKGLARVASYLPQSAASALRCSVRDLVRMARYPHVGRFARLSKEDEQAVEQALELTGMASRAERCVATLSGGERQRALIGAALAQGASILLLDEPTTHLDPRHQKDIHSLLERLHRELGLTAVMATHDLNFASLLSDKVLGLVAGRVVFNGTGAELMNNSALSRIFGQSFMLIDHPEAGARMLVPEGPAT